MASVHPQDTVDVPLAARRNASYDCEFVLDDVPLGRLAEAVGELVNLRARFHLLLDDQGRPRIEGRAEATVEMPCQRCLESVRVSVATELESLIWFGAEPPSEWAKFECDVIVSESSKMTYAALVEDDLLLALPQQVCQASDCPRLPVLAYPAAGYTAERSEEAEQTNDLADDRQRPFAGLRELLDGQADD